jgi:hypothetical protein
LCVFRAPLTVAVGFFSLPPKISEGDGIELLPISLGLGILVGSGIVI